jgi:hypothetical protein
MSHGRRRLIPQRSRQNVFTHFSFHVRTHESFRENHQWATPWLASTVRWEREIRGRRRVALTLTLRKIKERTIDWSKTSYNQCDLHIYRRLDISLFMNSRILTKYSKNLYSDLSLICENQTLWFAKPEPLVLQSGVSSKYHNFLVRDANHMFHIPILIISTRAGYLKSSVWVHLLVVSISSLFLEWNSTKLSEKHVYNLKNVSI